LKDLVHLEKLFGTVRDAVKIPLTIKIRSGWDENHIVAVEVARMAERIGVEAIAVHPRTRMQGYAGSADWNVIRDVKSAVKIPVIGNGDVRVPQDAVRMVETTGCDAVMIGRAASFNPWIFRQIADYLATGTYTEPTESDRYHLLAGYFRNLMDSGMPDAVGKMKQFASLFTHGVRNGGELRQAVHHSATGKEILEKVDAFFTQSTASSGD
jgi:nifR3 family TIM-barrel protein